MSRRRTENIFGKKEVLSYCHILNEISLNILLEVLYLPLLLFSFLVLKIEMFKITKIYVQLNPFIPKV